MTEVVIVRFMSRHEVNNFLDRLTDNGIIYKYQFYDRTILTGIVNIKFMVLPNGENEMLRVRGLRFKKCFGFVTEDARRYLTGTADYDNVTLLDYILEKMKRGAKE